MSDEKEQVTDTPFTDEEHAKYFGTSEIKAQMDQAFNEQVHGEQVHGELLVDEVCEAEQAGGLHYERYADSNTGILAARYAAEDLAARPSSLSQQSDYYNNPWQDQQLRQIALDYAVRMASMGNGDVVATAEAYYAFLKGDAAK